MLSGVGQHEAALVGVAPGDFGMRALHHEPVQVAHALEMLQPEKTEGLLDALRLGV